MILAVFEASRYEGRSEEGKVQVVLNYLCIHYAYVHLHSLFVVTGREGSEDQGGVHEGHEYDRSIKGDKSHQSRTNGGVGANTRSSRKGETTSIRSGEKVESSRDQRLGRDGQVASEGTLGYKYIMGTIHISSIHLQVSKRLL